MADTSFLEALFGGKKKKSEEDELPEPTEAAPEEKDVKAPKMSKSDEVALKKATPSDTLDASAVKPAEAKAEAQPKGANNGSQEESQEGQEVARALLVGLAPAIVGGVLGGSAGGQSGAQAGLAGIQKIEDQKKEERALRKEFKELSLKEKKEAREQNRLDQETAIKRGELKVKQQEAYAKLNPTQEQRLAKLSGEERKRYDNSLEAADAIDAMANALAAGDNTFSMVGDNDFTRNLSVFEEALGRMQSGGAISKAEEQRFKKMAPTAADSAEQRIKKLQNLKANMARRLATLGFDYGNADLPRGAARGIAKGGTLVENLTNPFGATEAVADEIPLTFEQWKQKRDAGEL